jgi:NADPH-dependent glutamate synthase beta subunit-like oxidoreductase
MAKELTNSNSRVEPAIAQFLSPCQVKCPLHEDIQRTNILISLLPEDPILAHPAILRIGDYLYEQNPFFTVCGYVCGLCELHCNYSSKGGAIRRRLLKRFIAETYTPHLADKPAWEHPRDREPVAIIGGGPAGLMAAYELSRRGYRVTVFEAEACLGGALRLIPHYRLPGDVLTSALDNLVRIAGIEVCCSTRIGDGELTLDVLRQRGFQAIFIAKGTPAPRILTFAGKRVDGQELGGVLYGHTILYEENHGHLPDGCFTGRRAVVVGGGNVALDAARTVRRLGARTDIVCLESDERGARDGIQVAQDEIRGALEEGIAIHYSRGVNRILGADGTVTGISSPRCLAIYDERGFNPLFDPDDCVVLPADLLIIAVGQGPEQGFLASEGLLDRDGRLAIDPLTLQSLHKGWIFIGGDLRAIGYMAEAMRDGVTAAESIHRYLRGDDLLAGRRLQYVPQEIPRRCVYRHEPDVEWEPPDQRLRFEVYEHGFSLSEAIDEARRCLACGPCASCKACVAAGLQGLIPVVEVAEERCSGCGICVSVCPYGAARLMIRGDVRTSMSDPMACKGCGLCVAACPAGARQLRDDTTMARVQGVLRELGGGHDDD